MTRRYYVPELLSQHPHVALPEEEALHAVRVMRLEIGAEIELFDGRGQQAAAKVVAVSRRECFCECETPQTINREPLQFLELTLALPKPERAKEMVERLTELGVARIVPLTFARTQRPPSPAILEKLQRIVVEACKQSGRNRLMTIEPVMTFTQFMTAVTEDDANSAECVKRFVAMPGGQMIQQAHTDVSTTSLQCTIGPEGGLTQEELAQCIAAGMRPIDLGKRILRIETAACVVASRLLVD